jgi:hypothetical protein
LAPDRGFGEAVQNGWLRMYSDYINENSGVLLEFYSENIAANSKSTIFQTLLSFREQSIVRVTVFKGKRVAEVLSLRSESAGDWAEQ